MTSLDHAGLMNRVYRHQRHVYDATRKYYLLGRDPMLAGLAVPDAGAVLELGCGTGRNLVEAAKLYPRARLFGIDISREMLATASSAVLKAGVQSRVRLACADAIAFDAELTFGRQQFDRIFISYAVSMISSWRMVMDIAVARLAPGGELHIVDFGDLGGLPQWTKSALYTWLRWYHVTPRATLFRVAADIAARNGCTVEERRLHRGFAWISVIRKPA